MEIGTELLDVFRSPTYQPPALPEVASQILALSQDENARLERFVGLLERDTMIAGRVLRVANSPFYTPASRNEITSLKEAIVRLGLFNLRNVVLEIWMRLRVFQAREYLEPMTRLSRHSSVTAHACDIVARQARWPNESAFLAGLLHDVGIAGSLSVLSDGRVVQPVPRLDEVRFDLDLLHEELSGTMIEHWGLSGSIRVAAMYHHRLLVDGRPDPLAAVVAVAEDLANELGWSVDEREQVELDRPVLDDTVPGVVGHAWDVLGLSGRDEVVIREKVEQAIDRIDWL